MLSIAVSTESGMSESYATFAAPLEVSVAAVTESALAPIPKRVSFPSRFGPLMPRWCTSGFPASSEA